MKNDSFQPLKEAYSAILLVKGIRMLILDTISLQMVLVRSSSLDENVSFIPLS
jgi:hypothetical protein